MAKVRILFRRMPCRSLIIAVVAIVAAVVWVGQGMAQPGRMALPADAIGIPESEAVAFLNKKKACFAWAALVWMTNAGPRMEPDIVCIFNGVSAHGTVREAQGCMM
jgi:hypothetical protein